VKRWSVAMLMVMCVVAVSGLTADSVRNLRARLRGFEEVPSVSTVASARLEARVSGDGDEINWTLSYADLEGTVTQAHIHIADKDVNGGISVWFCSNLASPPTPPGVQACPPPPATISGTFTSVDVVGPVAQGVDPGEFDELVRAIRAGLTYANVHSTRFPGGEVRGQVEPGRGRGDDHSGHQ
jgi:hypothetical protein